MHAARGASGKTKDSRARTAVQGIERYGPSGVRDMVFRRPGALSADTWRYGNNVDSGTAESGIRAQGRFAMDGSA